jgi:superfamily II DNA or RNA helicase
MAITPRDYQQDTLDAIQFQWNRGYNSTLAELFTSAGKTVIFIEYCKRFLDFSKQRMLVMTPAHIILQTRMAYSQFYPEFDDFIATSFARKYPIIGVEMADYIQPDARLIVGSVQTLIDRVPIDEEPITRQDIEFNSVGGIVKANGSSRRCLVSQRVDQILQYGMIDEIIFDEAHHAVAPGGYLIVNRLWEICRALNIPLTKLIGFTATAFRDDGIALSNLFQTICIRRSQKWAEQHGYVVPLKEPIRVFAQVPFGRENITNTSNWADLIVQAWKEKAECRPTVAYMPTVQSSRKLAEVFRENGIKAAHLESEKTIDVDGEVYDVEHREKIYEKILTGECNIISNYGVILEGTNLPPLSCMIWGRDTDNIGLTTQAIGRILRLFDGNDKLSPKQDALIIDVTANDLTVLTAGTLAGFKIDPDTGLYNRIEDDEIEVETISEGRDIRDVVKGVIHSSGLIYAIGKLIRKSGSDWYHDERFDVLSMSITKSDTLIIVPPFYTLATFLNNVEMRLETELEKQYAQVKYQEYANVVLARELFESYTLWHHKPNGQTKSWIHRDISLDRLMDFTIPYMNDKSDPIVSFISKSSSWKRKSMSDQQKTFLTKLCKSHKIEFDPLWTQGEASQIISHVLGFNDDVRVRIAQIYRSIAGYIN